MASQVVAVLLVAQPQGAHAFTCQKVVGAHPHVLDGAQYAVAQSAPTLHPTPYGHFVAHEPPQSSDVSLPLSRPSSHVDATHLPPTEQTPDAQSATLSHAEPTAQVARHVPPQSTLISPPLSLPSSQWVATHVLCTLHNAVMQSTS